MFQQMTLGEKLRRSLIVQALQGAQGLHILGVILPSALAIAWGFAILSMVFPHLVPPGMALGPLGVTDVLIGLVVLALIPWLIALVWGRMARGRLLARARAGAYDDETYTALWHATAGFTRPMIWLSNAVGWLILIGMPFWAIGRYLS